MRYTTIVVNGYNVQIPVYQQRKLTSKQKTQIVAKMQKLLVSYARENYSAATLKANDDSASEMLAMYANDLAYNTNALQQFVQDSNVVALHNALRLQDTAVREHFVSVLQYIERNMLVHENNLVCPIF